VQLEVSPGLLDGHLSEAILPRIDLRAKVFDRLFRGGLCGVAVNVADDFFPLDSAVLFVLAARPVRGVRLLERLHCWNVTTRPNSAKAIPCDFLSIC
jgi:hypothetical protein